MSGFWNIFTGKRPSTASPPSLPSSQSTAHPPDSGDSAPTTTFAAHPTAFDPSTVADLSSFLGPASLDPSVLHPLAGLNQGLSYLDLEDTVLSGSHSALPSRGWSDDLCYGTGTTYLVALATGGIWGLTEGLRKSPSGAPPRLKLNAVLNAMTRRGPFLGNSAGVLAMVYNGVNSTIGHVRGKHDTANSIVSGAITGAVFKSTRGVRPVVWSSVLVATAAGVWSVGSKVVL
ncbi:Mitochondrial import inner membrane translocase subunit tim23 [Maublancomyces gigas]|uniref:Mitochondrial import inner membrane translocase subunit TIM23 n=1 Tax=Discina gigas TaxID=1032678 RepID=A0ABR3GD30_9PEZI